MSGPVPVTDFLKSNTIKTYYSLDKAMLTACREDRNEYAESTARILLANSDLPLLIRARACMILGCSDSPDFLERAKQGVRIAELGYSKCSAPGKFEKNLVEDCKSVLVEAQAAFEDQKGEDEGEGEGEEVK